MEEGLTKSHCSGVLPGNALELVHHRLLLQGNAMNLLLRPLRQQPREAESGNPLVTTLPWGVLPDALQNTPRGLSPKLPL